MPRKPLALPVKMSFEAAGMHLTIADLEPLRIVTSAIKKSPKYAQTAASIREVGIIEPPISARRTAAGELTLGRRHAQPSKTLRHRAARRVIARIPMSG